MLTNIPSTQYTNVRQKTPSTPSKTPNQKPNTPNKRPSMPKYTKYAKYTKPNTKYTNKKACAQSKTQSTPKKTPNTPNIAVEIQKCEFVFQNFHLRFFVAKKFFVPNLRTLLVYFLQLKKYGGVKNMTNMRYAWSRQF